MAEETYPVIVLGMPTGSLGGRVDPEALARGTAMKATNGKYAVLPHVCQSSLLCHSFNTLWAGSLNMRTDRKIKYFAMIHDDICPEAGWLDTLIGEMEKYDADVVSAVVPIKEPTGVTSTAIDVTNDEWSPRRYTLKELWRMPETFTHERILLNSGLWVCKFDGDWQEKVWFEQHDRIVMLPNGKWSSDTKSEDWEFSRTLRKHGLKLYATRKVQLEHERAEWHTRFPWGLWDTDKMCEQGHHGVMSIPLGVTAAIPPPVADPVAA